MARILITGGAGMLGRTLARRFQAGNQVWAPGSREFDICDAAALTAGLARLHPEVVIHCAALTAVDRCESERALAFRVNRDGSANVARACQVAGARLLAISTDYIFSSTSAAPIARTTRPVRARSMARASSLARKPYGACAPII